MAVKAALKGKKEEISPPIASTESTLDESLELDEEQEEAFKVVESSKEASTPPFPAKTLRADKSHVFFDWVGKLTDSDLNHISFYLYRTWPEIDRKIHNPNNANYIECLSSKFSQADLIQTHGGGEYKIIVNDSNKAVGGKGGTLGHAFFSWKGADYPEPKLKLEEVVRDARANQTYVEKLIAEGKLTTDGKIMAALPTNSSDPAMIALLGRLIEKLTNTPAPPSQNSTTNDVSKMFLEANSAVVGMLKDQVKSDGPDKTISLITAIQGMMPKPDSNHGLLEIFMKMQMEASARADAATTRLMEVLSRPAPDNESKWLEKIQSYKELFGGGDGGEGKAIKRTTAEVIVDAVAPMALKGLEIVTQLLAMKNYQAGLAMQGTAPQAQPAPSGEAQPQPQIEGNVLQMPDPNKQQTELRALLLGPAGHFLLSALDRGENGFNFAESVKTLLGVNKFTAIQNTLKTSGVPAVIEGAKQIPEFWQNVGSEESIQLFLTEFIEFDPLAEPEEEKE